MAKRPLVTYERARDLAVTVRRTVAVPITLATVIIATTLSTGIISSTGFFGILPCISPALTHS